ncbi:hypothetical protein BJY16_001756 [Actinoplanes octamycinicus]|uniref:Uncharacterized protein n=1 Tax=Actinoplanes octamycinicus TaxID=135948 RepID=A0A7W7GU55_9ACTN|nr:hypothetical protein [Actinoplanes octamycinicus]MBB4738297.1 hypothetical protein [Actinoplanes octamycinicus]GIE57415.1 hypothetical protein Aoc01nite_28170 [Actinoplanes octamycinicus]
MTAPDENSLPWRNRRVIAERLGWPHERLADCERLDRDYPGWSVTWWDSRNGKPAVFRAQHRVRWRYFTHAAGATEAELLAAMAEQDRLAAEQLAEWRSLRPAGSAVIGSQ